MGEESTKRRYLHKRRETFERGWWSEPSGGGTYEFLRREDSFEIALDDEAQEVGPIIQRQVRRNKRGKRALLISLLVAAALFFWAVFEALVAGWIQKDCELGIRDFVSGNPIKRIETKCFNQIGTPGSSLKTRE